MEGRGWSRLSLFQIFHFHEGDFVRYFIPSMQVCLVTGMRGASGWLVGRISSRAITCARRDNEWRFGEWSRGGATERELGRVAFYIWNAVRKRPDFHGGQKLFPRGSSQLVLIKCRSSARSLWFKSLFPEGNYTVNDISNATTFPPSLFIRSLVSHLGLGRFLPR